ncbi:MAG: DUF2169 domain-containing protein [Syntrophales bacterium]
MKIYKKKEHSLLIKPFGIRDRLYMAVTVIVYFDLTAPDEALTEQDLWKNIPGQLGKTPILDQGMPKPRGEVLVTGSCFAPRGQKRPASQVSFRVGELGKGLVVFGNRYWHTKGGIVTTMTDFELFGEMPVTYENAFGGKDFALNPLGKGANAITRPDGQTIIPLPNIEDLRHLVASPNDRPDPSGFGPLDMTWPQRMKKTGTYDDKWLRENWPWFPDDMNYEFFNCAPEDQYITEFFKGNETLEIRNMHPDLPVISSHLPPLRIRCFVTKRKDLKNNKEEEMFQEVTTRIDTVWLFPTILRGVVMYRGTTEILDEEYADVLRIFVATERLSDQPKTIEFYLEEQQKAKERKVPIDMGPFQAGAKQIGDAMKRLKKIPADIEAAIQPSLGKAPFMPRTPAETAATGKTVISDNLALLDRLEANSRDLHSQFGHLVRVDLDMFDRMRGSLKQMSANIDRDLGTIEKAVGEAQAAVAQGKQDLIAGMKQHIPKAALAEAGIDPDTFLDFKKDASPWHDRGFPYVVQWRRQLEQDDTTLQALRNLGLDQRALKKSWLGLHREETTDDRTLWGLKPETDKDGSPKPLLLPSGLVLPRFDGAILNRILILPEGWQEGKNLASGTLVEGSAAIPLFLPCEEGAPVVRTADELQAWYVEKEIGDACSVIALADPGEKPDEAAAKEIKDAPLFIVILPANAGAKDREAWSDKFPNALLYPLPKGDTVFAAHRLGIDIRNWIMEAMPTEFVKRHQVAPILPLPGNPPTAEELTVPIPKVDVKALMDKLGGQIKAAQDNALAPHLSKMAAAKQEAVAAITQAALAAGVDPAAVLGGMEKQHTPSFDKPAETMAAKIRDQIEMVRSSGDLTPAMEKTMNDEAERLLAQGRQAQQQYDAGMARIASAKDTIATAVTKAKAGEMPAAAKEKFKKHGMDPDRMVKRTREEVVAMHGEGESLAFAILSEVDLSGLDLRGIDLHQAQCLKTRFTGANLDGADLSQVMFIESDFAKASLRGAKMERTMFIKTKLMEAKFQEAQLSQTIFMEADLTGANFTGATLYLSSTEKTPLIKARFGGVKAELCSLASGDASEADFQESRFTRCIFRSLTMDRANFSRAAFSSTLFMEVQGKEVIFLGAEMEKGRMSNKCSLPGADFRNVHLTNGSFRDSDLAGASFRGGVLDGTMMESCDLHGADLYGVSAKTCRFFKTNLEGADLRFVNLLMGSLRKARLVKADLRGANLFAVDFYKAILGETNFTGANLKMSMLHEHRKLLENRQEPLK